MAYDGVDSPDIASVCTRLIACLQIYWYVYKINGQSTKIIVCVEIYRCVYKYTGVGTSIQVCVQNAGGCTNILLGVIHEWGVLDQASSAKYYFINWLMFIRGWWWMGKVPPLLFSG